MKKVVVLISGRGSNMQALVNANLPCEIAAVISNKEDAGGLAFAATRNIPTAVLSHKGFSSREAFDAEMIKLIDSYQPDLVVLAGFMRILSADFVNHYQNRLINIHPSLLPSFKGLHTHQQALDAGVKLHGCSVHFVTAELDHGPIIAQAAVPVLPDDTEDSLASRVLTQEHIIYPQSVKWFVEDKLTILENGTVRISH
ncbi:phosphoribosylglycinamide formyltransferase [Leeia sp. TBRC 13508]|uniref:Phosphoribosylglycinamide formyltransferase n=1 Tax=Leeia speluncae TaxID=2884804 RepID=A0ABS8D2X7_9NEIS|nr:phosphoribosylglycinamide formyltransferase [Leeia speluncae]MCB6182541.1 phosphoribosylglycinamide formyltransferase [Leeia speluncae]